MNQIIKNKDINKLRIFMLLIKRENSLEINFINIEKKVFKRLLCIQKFGNKIKIIKGFIQLKKVKLHEGSKDEKMLIIIL